MKVIFCLVSPSMTSQCCRCLHPAVAQLLMFQIVAINWSPPFEGPLAVEQVKNNLS